MQVSYHNCLPLYLCLYMHVRVFHMVKKNPKHKISPSPPQKRCHKMSGLKGCKNTNKYSQSFQLVLLWQELLKEFLSWGYSLAILDDMVNGELQGSLFYTLPLELSLFHMLISFSWKRVLLSKTRLYSEFSIKVDSISLNIVSNKCSVAPPPYQILKLPFATLPLLIFFFIFCEFSYPFLNEFWEYRSEKNFMSGE